MTGPFLKALFGDAQIVIVVGVLLGSEFALIRLGLTREP